MSADHGSHPIPLYVPHGYLASVSPKARILLDGIIAIWLRDTPEGEMLVHEMGHAGATIGVLELLDCGGMRLKVNEHPWEDPRFAMTLTLTPAGKAFGLGLST
jgi:hypothetical protein